MESSVTSIQFTNGTSEASTSIKDNRCPIYGLDMILELSNGKLGVIEAQIDTGASTNFITPELVKHLQKEGALNIEECLVEPYQYEGNLKDMQLIHTAHFFNGDVFHITNKFKMTFRAGIHGMKFEDVEFEILDKKVGRKIDASKESDEAMSPIEANPANNNQCDILLGAAFLAKTGILKVDDEYCCRAPGGYERLERYVVREEGEEECHLTNSTLSKKQGAASSSWSGTALLTGPAQPQPAYAAVRGK